MRGRVAYFYGVLAILALVGLTTSVVSAQEPPDEPREIAESLRSAGIPLLNSPPAPSTQPPPAQPGREAPPQAIPVDLPIPDPTDWIPNPTDWIPGGLNPLTGPGTS
jgi:hypothetical protein